MIDKTSRSMATEQAPSGIRIYLNHRWNLVKTGFLLLTWIVLGFHLELVGPTMPFLASNIKASYSGMGSVLASRGAGYFAANILGIILQGMVKKHSFGLLVCACLLPAIVMFATPFVTSLSLMCVLFFAQGAAQGSTDLGGTNIILRMWGAHAAAPMNTVHLGYGIGAVFVNLLARPFLTRGASPPGDLSNGTVTLASLSDNPVSKDSNIAIPYCITGALCLVIAAGHLFFYIQEMKTHREIVEVRQADYAAVSTSPDKNSASVDKEVSSPYSPRTCGRGYFQYGLILSMIFIFYIFFIGGNDQTFSKFFFTYLRSDRFQISTNAASWGIILYWLSYSIGRFIGAILSVFLSVSMCLNIVWAAGLCLAIAWLIFVWTIGLTSTSLFILGAATGLVFAPFFPLSFGLINQRLNATPVLLALLFCGSALGAIIFQKLAGFVMDSNPKHFPTLLIVCILMSIVLYVASNIVYFVHERKNLASARASITHGVPLVPDSLNEEERQLSDYVKNQDNK